jgi:hypothetical protein
VQICCESGGCQPLFWLACDAVDRPGSCSGFKPTRTTSISAAGILQPPDWPHHSRFCGLSTSYPAHRWAQFTLASLKEMTWKTCLPYPHSVPVYVQQAFSICTSTVQYMMSYTTFNQFKPKYTKTRFFGKSLKNRVFGSNFRTELGTKIRSLILKSA